MAMVRTPVQYKKYEEKDIPAELVRDVIDGVPYYYKGYKDVLNKTKTIEEIMPCSTLQAEIIMYLNYLLVNFLGIEKFRIYTSESGSHLYKKVNYGLDLAVYDATVLTSEKVNEKFANVPPLLVVEVDIKVETKEEEIEFINKKMKSLLDHGTGKVIWILTKERKIIIAEKNQEQQAIGINDNFELITGLIANVGEYLTKREINF